MALQVVAVITAKPGSEEIVQGALRDLVGATRQEEGCLSYELNRSAADGAVFVTVEQWREQADLDAHLQTPHLQKALEVAGEHLAVPPAIHPLMPVA
ncbi:antibiotic biosynthesis monooxygenase [Actinomycetospora endophytica]|uniref:Antibiotic biosynthesis monooxygenase n=1 Tax=Actinomycetospora endophytica TaxID=2291215 RepID=A0ABS8P8W2_9PSEU|nr:putative quinol monooxygenase [Actinomycetospora endophytica]MCD2194695.1 antibiotic biosynthesis monooxygenase [Actinomycetospora endophytica]